MTAGRPMRVVDEAGFPVPVVPDGESSFLAIGPGRGRLQRVDGSFVDVVFELDPTPVGEVRTVEVVVDGWRFVLTIEDEERARLRERARRSAAASAHASRAEVRSVIPGRIVAVDVAEGDIVAVGDRLLVVEAMKMQNEIRSPVGGTVGQVGVRVGWTVEVGSVLVVIG
ncbi:MAG TPA: acetyl-CoA carboxylase biotin carboxyl carrier protein subunit [Candidatus Limnocylindrales bacterium]|nr:acetyl-CoA carboxylase biotin carboxyl carrier protein subunit [Candidatus Limnocylindrales bacterium]